MLFQRTSDSGLEGLRAVRSLGAAFEGGRVAR